MALIRPDMQIVQPHITGQYSRARWTLPAPVDAVLVSDPNSILVSPITQAANGEFTAILKASPGAIDFTDPGDAAFIAWSARDVFNQPLIATSSTQPAYSVKAYDGATLFGNSDDAWCMCGFSTEANLASATVAAIGHGMYFTAMSRYARFVQVINGVDTPGDSGAVATIRGFVAHPHVGPGGYAGHRTIGVNASGAQVAYTTFPSALNSLVAAQLYFWLAFGRTANTASQVTGSFIPRYQGLALDWTNQ